MPHRDRPRRSGEPVAGIHGRRGSFVVLPTDKRDPDFRAHGRLQYVGSLSAIRRNGRVLPEGRRRLAGDPARLRRLRRHACRARCARRRARRLRSTLKRWTPHARDWRAGDPTWKDGKGKGFIGALNYLAAQRRQHVLVPPYNAGGDGDNVWPFVERDDQSALRLLEARSVGDRVRSRHSARSLPALQASGDRERRQSSSATACASCRRHSMAASWASSAGSTCAS